MKSLFVDLFGFVFFLFNESYFLSLHMVNSNSEEIYMDE
jgi:hypothetical protein